MKIPHKIGIFIFAAIVILLLLFGVAHGNNFAVFNPAGTIARQERTLIFITLFLSLFVVLPVFILTFFIVWKYREEKQATYKPEVDHNTVAETIWWAIPSLIILILGVITWNTSHSLDPAKPLNSPQRSLTVQVIALQWRWLFIYPDQHLASLNQLKLPVNTPIHFEITSDAPMNSFWIPQLGSQIYAMPGMTTTLNLEADKLGKYRGSSANLSGTGFAGMDFPVSVVNQSDFYSWASEAFVMKPLDQQEYNLLAIPSTEQQPQVFTLSSPSIFTTAVMKYMMPADDLVRAEALQAYPNADPAVLNAIMKQMAMPNTNLQ